MERRLDEETKMDQLLPYYERELSFLRRYSQEFARSYPKIAARLGLGGDTCEDPHVERLIESFALLTARVHCKLDDDYPQFTEALFEALYPHYLRPFPSCSIAQFDASGTASQLSVPVVIPRGTQLESGPVREVQCQFRTAYDVTLTALEIQEASFIAGPAVPSTVRVPPGVTARLSLRLVCRADQLSIADVAPDRLRVYLHGEPSFVATMRDCLFLRPVAAFVETGENRWEPLASVPIREVGLEVDEALIDYPPASHPAYRLLTEHAAFPEKFNFFDIDLQAMRRQLGSAREATLHFSLAGLHTDSNAARLLETLCADHLRLGCTPVVNLFVKAGEPIRMTHTRDAYPVIACAKRPYAYEVMSIDSVQRVRQSDRENRVTVFRPFYALHHGQRPEDCGQYWSARRDDALAARNPGYETEISLVDVDFDPEGEKESTISLTLTCTNRDLPATLAVGQPGGDLFRDGGTTASRINLLRRPTTTSRFSAGKSAHWRLISHLSLNHLSLVRNGLPALKDTLRLYDISQSTIFQRQVDGLQDVDYCEVTRWMPGQPFATFVRGIEVTLTVDERHFVGCGLHAFMSVISRYLGLYVHANSFCELVVVPVRGEGEIMRCKPRTGDAILA
jgi:type VI secretion system protein ImpG